ncbi:MAG: helix-turn-helix domain-containing protein [Anaerolineaceae bacterium]|nr:MAG: helix-turn-helix domain-containing protein [Anaerolineaceae bacterium]
MAEEWLTTAEAADLSGYHAERVRELLREQKIKGRKFGIVWQVDRASLLSYIESMEEKGRRRGPKPGSDISQT